MLLRSGAVKVRLRRSARARRMRLVLVPGVGPELVVPVRARPARSTARSRRSHRGSSGRSRASGRERSGSRDPGVAWHGGEPVALRVVDRQAARAPTGAPVRSSCAHPTADARREALERWYRESARDALAASIERQAPAIGVAPKTLAVRDQRTRWGSCSARGTLSFSWRLLLAPAWVLDDVVCHELCHLRVANHSQAFWSLFARAPAGGRLAPLAARARRRACRLPAGG